MQQKCHCLLNESFNHSSSLFNKTSIFAYIVIIFSLMCLSVEAVEPIHLDFSEDSSDKNRLLIMAGGFGSFPIADIRFGEIPTSEEFPTATDGHGAIIEAEPGEGIMMFSPLIRVPKTVLIRCSIRMDGPHGSVTLACLDQSSNQLLSTFTPNNGALLVNEYYRMVDILPATMEKPVQGILQIINSSTDKNLTAYVDNMELVPLEPNVYYHEGFISGDQSDPNPLQITPAISTPTSVPSPTEIITTPTPTLTMTPMQTPIHTATPTSTPSNTATQTATPTSTPSPAQTQTATPTPTPSLTPTFTMVPTSTSTPIPLFTATPTSTNSPTPLPTQTPAPDKTSTPTPTPTRTPTPTFSPTPHGLPTEKIVTIPDLPNDAEPLKLNLIEPGTFTMGAPLTENGVQLNEVPAHEVTITKPFYMGVYEVTQAQWETVMGTNHSGNQGDPDLPVENVSWTESERFLDRLNRLHPDDELTYRLPTEAEWEYAYRAGTQTRYYWGEDPNRTMAPNYAWFYTDQFSLTSQIVGQKLPNAWGLYDMAGNIAEWCHDWFGSYSLESKVDPQGPSIGEIKVLRNTFWGGAYFGARAAFRGGEYPLGSAQTISFRVAQGFKTPSPTPIPAEEEVVVELPGLSVNAKPLVLVKINPSTFLMGSPEDEEDHREDESPQHEVTITKPYYLGKYEVTQAQWEAVMGSNPSVNEEEAEIYGSTDNLPVNNVSWIQCQEFLTRLNNLISPEEGDFRLPTEAEWEHAYRAGTTTRYHWGEDLRNGPIIDYAVFFNTSFQRPNPVGSKKPNPWGLYNMPGNMKEWCHDWYGPYPSLPVSDYKGPSIGTERVIRGTSFGEGLASARAASRSQFRPDEEIRTISFRIAQSLEHTSPTPQPTIPPGEDDIIHLDKLQEGAQPLTVLRIEPGTFTMGSPATETGHQDIESPQREITITRPYYIGKTEVTQAQWNAIMDKNPSHFTSNPDYPVDTVSWFDCLEFLERLNAIDRDDSWIYRLPTEAEWEYAYRAETTTRFYWGDDPSNIHGTEYAWYFNSSSQRSHRAGTKRPNAWGLYNMAGNMKEWCLDWFAPYSDNDTENPVGPPTGDSRVVRGTFWGGALAGGRAANREGFNPDFSANSISFRVVRIKVQPAPEPTPPTAPEPAKHVHFGGNISAPNEDALDDMVEDNLTLIRYFAQGPVSDNIKMINLAAQRDMKIIIVFPCGNFDYGIDPSVEPCKLHSNSETCCSICWWNFDLLSLKPEDDTYKRRYTADPDGYADWVDYRLSVIERTLPQAIGETVIAVQFGNEEEGKWRDPETNIPYSGEDGFYAGRIYAEYFYEASQRIYQKWPELDTVLGSIESDKTLDFDSGGPIPGVGINANGFLHGFVFRMLNLTDVQTNYFPDVISFNGYSGIYPPEHRTDFQHEEWITRLQNLDRLFAPYRYQPNYAVAEFGWSPIEQTIHGTIGANERTQAIYMMRQVLMQATMMSTINNQTFKYSTYFEHSYRGGKLQSDTGWFKTPQLPRAIRKVGHRLFTVDGLGLNQAKDVHYPAASEEMDNYNIMRCGWTNERNEKWYAIWKYENNVMEFKDFAPTTETFALDVDSDVQVKAYRFKFNQPYGYDNTEWETMSTTDRTVEVDSENPDRVLIHVPNVTDNPVFLKLVE